MNNIKNDSTNKHSKPKTLNITKYYVNIFIIFIAGSLVVAILILNDILIQLYDDSNTLSTSINNSPITEQSTIDRLNKLETSAINNNYQTTLPGKINPFAGQ